MRELSLHILDLARNCIEAGATAMRIAVSESAAADELRIEIIDNGCGMDAETLAHACDPFYTTRTTRRVGMGLSLFRETCERCAGTMRVDSRPGEGTRVAGTLRLDHLDRPPLGDMGAAIAALACEASRVRLTYKHTTDSERFELDTGQVEEEFGPGALSHPATLLWLQEYIREGVQATGSTA